MRTLSLFRALCEVRNEYARLYNGLWSANTARSCGQRNTIRRTDTRGVRRRYVVRRRRGDGCALVPVQGPILGVAEARVVLEKYLRLRRANGKQKKRIPSVRSEGGEREHVDLSACLRSLGSLTAGHPPATQLLTRPLAKRR